MVTEFYSYRRETTRPDREGCQLLGSSGSTGWKPGTVFVKIEISRICPYLARTVSEHTAKLSH